jgi:hypothetical protein
MSTLIDAPPVNGTTRHPAPISFEYVFSPFEGQIPSHLSPQYVQQSVRLFDFCHDHVAECAACLVKKANSKSFRYLCISAIPSLFGYFSSAEHINLAMKFYIAILSQTDSELGSTIFIPFFSAPGLYSFLESSLNPFFQRFLKDSRVFTKTIKNLILMT